MSARAEESDLVHGLALGGDDYVVKPFSLNELAARVKAVLRRTLEDGASSVIEIGDLRIDTGSHDATLGDKKLDLMPREFALLTFFARHPGQAFPRDVLLDRVWGQEAFVNVRTIDVHVRWLRMRIEVDPANPTRLVTVRGVGFKFKG